MPEVDERKDLQDALVRMYQMWERFMQQANHGNSAYDADTIRELNEAPIQAVKALRASGVTEISRGKAEE